jgi:nicotinate phosphoribosyltransferase
METNRTMLTDLYQITMGAAYLDNQKDGNAAFEMFIRKLPKDWGFFIANGIEDLVDYATNLRFTDEDIAYLREQGTFTEAHLDFFKNFKFEGTIYAVKEGTPITPNAPLFRVEGKRTQAQFLETLLLNTVNFQTMIATKANRVLNAAAPAGVLEFGLRRAQEMDAAMKGARATYLAGCSATSNVLAGKEYGIPIRGTHAHSFVMSFPTELEAFRAYVKTFPNNPTLLIDTYDPIQGAKNAAIVAKELEEQGKRLGAVRLDSRDMAQDSIVIRKMFDEQGLGYVKITASNDLNEYKITELKQRGARIESYGVGTEMITAKPIAALSGVYKLVEDEDGAKIKLAQDKVTYPGRKQVWRVLDEQGNYAYDVLALADEIFQGIPLLEKVVENGKRLTQARTLTETRQYCLGAVAKLPQTARELHAIPYELRTSPKLDALVRELTTKYQQEVKQ